MDEIASLLPSRRPTQPPQVAALKKYAKDNHDVDILVKTAPKYYLITVPGAALAQQFRVETQRITAECRLDKRLVIHIGH